MSGSKARPGGLVLSWLSVFIIVFGTLSWLPAAAQDATPGSDGVPVVETSPTLEPEAPEPTSQPATDPPANVQDEEPAELEAPDPPEDEADSFDPPVAEQDFITVQNAPQVTAIKLTCEVRGATIDGVVSVTDPDASTIDLRLVTTDVPAIDTLQDIDVELEPDQTNYTFEAELDPDDFPASTTKEVVVTGPDGTPVSEPIAIEADGNGDTVCVPESTTTPIEPTTTDPGGDPTVVATATETVTATATTAPASSVGRVSNTGGSNLNCRAQPNTLASIITRIPSGSTVEVRGAAANGWVPVRCANQEGWVSADYLVVTTAPSSTATPVSTAIATTTPAPGTMTFATVSNTGGSNLRCRTAANTTASIITLLPAGSRVETRGAAVNGWLPVRCGDQDGWVSASYMVLSNGSTNPTPPATTTPTTPTPGGSSSIATVSGTGGAGVRCRTAPVSGAVILVLPELSRVEVTGAQQNGWAPVRCANQTGWVSATYLLFNVGSGSASGEIWMDVNLSTQYMIVYQGDKAIGRTYVSTGRPGFLTPTGTCYINRKVPVKDMTGTLGGEYYYVHDVPSVMYFTNRGHAIHGAYWHNNFG